MLDLQPQRSKVPAASLHFPGTLLAVQVPFVGLISRCHRVQLLGRLHSLLLLCRAMVRCCKCRKFGQDRERSVRRFGLVN